jgi:hypothetical protein
MRSHAQNGLQPRDGVGLLGYTNAFPTHQEARCEPLWAWLFGKILK